MEFRQDVKRFTPIVIILILGVLTFFMLKPILISISWGLILAYLFMPIYKKINTLIKSKNVSAFLVLLLSILIIIVPLWFIVPLLANQVFEVFKASQVLNVKGIITSLFPTASELFLIQLTTALNSFVSGLSSLVLNSLASFLINSLNILVNLLITAFVFFYALRDNEKLKSLAKDLSPISKAKEKIVAKQFKDITGSLIYGQIIIGLVQGVLAGIGFFVFGVPNPLVLTAIAILFSMIPVIGPWIVWVPIAVFLFIDGNTGVGLLFVLYNVLIVSSVDNLLRMHIVSRRVNLSPGIIFIGMMGGDYSHLEL